MRNLDVLFVNAPSAYPGSMLSHRIQGLPPLGLGYIATYLKKYGYQVRILDFYIRTVTLAGLDAVLSEQSPAVVGISATTETYYCGVRIASYIKKRYPQIIVVMGGCHVTFQYEDALKTGYIDYIIRNEGEFTFKFLLDYLVRGGRTDKRYRGNLLYEPEW